VSERYEHKQKGQGELAAVMLAHEKIYFMSFFYIKHLALKVPSIAPKHLSHLSNTEM
jgi:hypothetical protein